MPPDTIDSHGWPVEEIIAIGEPDQSVTEWIYITEPVASMWSDHVPQSYVHVALQLNMTKQELQNSLRPIGDSDLASRYAGMLREDLDGQNKYGDSKLRVRYKKLMFAASKFLHHTGGITRSTALELATQMANFDRLSLKACQPELACIATLFNDQSRLVDAEFLFADTLRIYNNLARCFVKESSPVPRFACGAIVEHNSTFFVGVIYGLNDYCSAMLPGQSAYVRGLPRSEDVCAASKGEPVYSLIGHDGEHLAVQESDLEIISCRACGDRDGVDPSTTDYGVDDRNESLEEWLAIYPDRLDLCEGDSWKRLFRKKKNGGKCGLVPARVMTSPEVLAKWPAIPGACADRHEECGDNLTLKVLDEQIFGHHEA